MSDLYGVTTAEAVVEWVRSRGVTPLFLAVSGSHMWNLARPDSDLDIRGIYLDPLEKVLALHPGQDTVEAVDILGGKVDLQLYELGKALRMLDNNNGNLVELFLADTAFYSAPTPQFWEQLAKRFLTKSLAKYYVGYYTSQRNRAAKNRGSKALVYTYREALAGIVLLETGELIHDFWALKERFRRLHPEWDFALLEAFMRKEYWREPVSEEPMRRFEAEWDRLLKMLCQAEEHSTLPGYHGQTRRLNQILLDARLGRGEWRELS